jgi:glycosyltransferase involved in cell wall biosynthesis
MVRREYISPAGAGRNDMHLSVTPYVPTSLSPYAGHQFYYSLLSALAAERPVAVIAPRTESNVAALDDPHRSFDVHLTAPRASAGTPGARIRRRAGFRQLAEFHPMPVIDDRALEWSQRAESFDLQWSESLVFSAQLARYGRPIFAVAYDIFWTTIAPKPGPRLIGRPIAPLRRAAIRREELSGLSRCGMVVVFKAADAERLERAGYRGRTVVASPTLQEPSGGLLEQTPPVVLFVGAFDRKENYEGAEWFLNEVLPRLRSAGATARYVFAGAGMPTDLAARAAALGVETTGFVADLDQVYRQATIAIAPLHRPGGLRFKVPQAMKYGLAVVATSEALQGLEGAPAGVLPGYDRPDDFAGAIGDLLADEERRTRMGRAAQAWVDSHFCADATFSEVNAWLRRGTRP